MYKLPKPFQLEHKVAIITGGAGLLGVKHAEAIAELGGIPILWDIDEKRAMEEAEKIRTKFQLPCLGMKVDITEKTSVKAQFYEVLKQVKRVDILINNAAHDPKVSVDGDMSGSRLENFDLDRWNKDIAVGLTGALICSQLIGFHMAEQGGGVILNIASDLALIAPDQRLYRKEGLPKEQQPVKPVTYSVVKSGLIGLTRYLASYWAEEKVRCNALAPGGVYNNQPEEFVERIAKLIPMGRMAQADEYKGAIQYLVSDASSFMTGAVLSVDGGRTCW